jgi:hypothetical protein
MAVSILRKDNMKNIKEFLFGKNKRNTNKFKCYAVGIKEKDTHKLPTKDWSNVFYTYFGNYNMFYLGEFSCSYEAEKRFLKWCKEKGSCKNKKDFNERNWWLFTSLGKANMVESIVREYITE